MTRTFAYRVRRCGIGVTLRARQALAMWHLHAAYDGGFGDNRPEFLGAFQPLVLVEV